MVRLNRTYYSLLKITSKIFQIPPVKFQRITQIPRSSPTQVREFRKIRTIRLTCYTLCFSHLSRQRTLQNSSKLRKFRAVRPHSPRITRNSHILLTYSTLCFRHLPQQRTLSNSSELRKFHAIRPHSPRITRNSHILLTYSTLCFRHLPQQRTLSNSSELRKFHAIRPHSPRIT